MDVVEMLPLYEDPCFTFRFADDRIIPRFHLEGVEAGQQVSVFRIDPGTGERLGLLAVATVSEVRWELPVHVSLAPLGHTDLGWYTVSASVRVGCFGCPARPGR